MIAVRMTSHADYNEWRNAARLLLQNDILPTTVDWSGAGTSDSLFASSARSVFDLDAQNVQLKVPASFAKIGKRVICHRDPERFARLYNIAWRLQSQRFLLDNAIDSDIIWLTNCDKAVRRDRHKMHAFVRFRRVGTCESRREQFAAWFEPGHYITELAAPFFTRRFPNMDWIIVTPDCTAVWDGKQLKYGRGGHKTDIPADDAIEEQWKTYFASIFNPARLKVAAMMSEMPKKYWKNLPEASLIPELIETARAREHSMRLSGVTEANPLAKTLQARARMNPSNESIESLADAKNAIQNCRRCPLYREASQAVFGDGPVDADLMIVGEQPGDKEDIAGRPFVGPAGAMLDSALQAAGISRSQAYVTNAVKHFKFKSRGKRRIHEKPNASEIEHCRWWLDTERELVKPKVIIALGASAARSVLGSSAKIANVRGLPLELNGGTVAYITTHPSYLLRLKDKERQEFEYRKFVTELTLAGDHLRDGLRG